MPPTLPVTHARIAQRAFSGPPFQSVPLILEPLQPACGAARSTACGQGETPEAVSGSIEPGESPETDKPAQLGASPEAAESESSDEATDQDESTTGESGDHESGGNNSESERSGSDEHDGGD